jgi:hypothetical protein
VGSAGHARRGIVGLVVACRAPLSGPSAVVVPPLHVHLMQPRSFRGTLAWAIIARMAVETARMPQHLRDLGEGLGRVAGGRLRREGGWHHQHRQDGADPAAWGRALRSFRQR